jgi:hypothetical protein
VAGASGKHQRTHATLRADKTPKNSKKFGDWLTNVENTIQNSLPL